MDGRLTTILLLVVPPMFSKYANSNGESRSSFTIHQVQLDSLDQDKVGSAGCRPNPASGPADPFPATSSSVLAAHLAGLGEIIIKSVQEKDMNGFSAHTVGVS